MAETLELPEQMRHTEPLTYGTIALAISAKSFTPFALFALSVALSCKPMAAPDEDVELVEFAEVESEALIDFK